MMLIDTNVLIDLAVDRPPDSLASRDLVREVEITATTAFVAWHSIATLYYIAGRQVGWASARAFVEELIGLLTVVPTGNEALRYALSLPMSDFEDAMQVAAAHAAGSRHIVTRNLRDFTNSPIPAITPEQALRELFQSGG